MPITATISRPARVRAVRDTTRMRIFRADIDARSFDSAQDALADASRQVTAAGAPVRLLYVRATYSPAQHPWVALFLASGDDAVTHVSETARVPFAAISEVRTAVQA